MPQFASPVSVAVVDVPETTGGVHALQPSIRPDAGTQQLGRCSSRLMNAATGYRKHAGDYLYDPEARDMGLKARVIGEGAFHLDLLRMDDDCTHIPVGGGIEQGDGVLTGQHPAYDHGMDRWPAIEQGYATGIVIHRTGYDSTRIPDDPAEMDPPKIILVHDQHASPLQHLIDGHARSSFGLFSESLIYVGT